MLFYYNVKVDTFSWWKISISKNIFVRSVGSRKVSKNISINILDMRKSVTKNA